MTVNSEQCTVNSEWKDQRGLWLR